MQKQVVRAALYGRVSTVGKGQDCENQLSQLRDFVATQQGWSITGQYIDEASAKNSHRKAFKRLFEDASKRNFDIVLFWSLDRFSREGVSETLHHLERLTSYGVGWRSFTEQYLDSCGLFKDAVLAILAVIAKQERIRLSERTLAGLERARKAGRIGGRPKLVLDRTSALEMRANGASIAQIADAFSISKTSAARLTAQ
ncbi:MAG TPA: recombinase family protein [Bryobacteraceae bacterium]|nr:recombinase family protein [Bryobacteraceae bacterium]